MCFLKEWKRKYNCPGRLPPSSHPPHPSLQTCCKMKPFSPALTCHFSGKAGIPLPQPSSDLGVKVHAPTLDSAFCTLWPLPVPETWWVHPASRPCSWLFPLIHTFFPQKNVLALISSTSLIKLYLIRGLPLIPGGQSPLPQAPSPSVRFNLVQPLIILTNYACLLIGLMVRARYKGGLLYARPRPSSMETERWGFISSPPQSP